MVISQTLNSLFSVKYEKLPKRTPYDYDRYDWNKVKVTLLHDKLNNKDTYCLIFNKDQLCAKPMYECLRATPEIKLIYQGPPAVNKTPGHGRSPRNFLVIFEYEPQVQPVPQVPIAG